MLMISRLQRELTPRDEEGARPYEIGCSEPSAFASIGPRRISLTAWMMFQADAAALVLAVFVAQAFLHSSISAPESGTVPGRFVGQAAIGLTVAACCVLSVARYEGRLSVRNELEQLFLISGISFGTNWIRSVLVHRRPAAFTHNRFVVAVPVSGVFGAKHGTTWTECGRNMARPYRADWSQNRMLGGPQRVAIRAASRIRGRQGSRSWHSAPIPDRRSPTGPSAFGC